MEHTFDLDAYEVRFGHLHTTLSPWFAHCEPTAVLVVTDDNTHELCYPLLREALGLADDQPVAEIQAGERAKNLTTAEALWQTMFDLKLDRRSLVVNLGGGMLGDLAGFCASTFKRGVPFIHIPTTLLAATDAAIGGKNGVNFNGVKNTLGTFRDPAAVFVDPAFFRTLPARELRSGFAEVVKHALIGDPALWQLLLGIDDLTAADWYALTPPSIAVKVRIVREDPLEKDLRRLLNFGHTVGHAIESYGLGTFDVLTHGEAVAIGIIAESYLAWGDSERTQAIANRIVRFFGRHPVHKTAFEMLWSTMQQDKKNEGGVVRVAVPGDAPYTLRMLEPTREQVEESLVFYNRLPQE
jgi:3-dehydroquinate synthase